MEFKQKLNEHIDRILGLKDSICTEEATKTSMIMPFFQMLGYDIFNPNEFIPEYTADVGIKKNEKVDYAIVFDSKPLILIECKSCSTRLDKHSSQLFRYYGTTDAKFGILTNGLVYMFYTDLDNTNKMDSTPFLTIDLEEIQERDVLELQKFAKEVIDVEGILNSAENLKYTRLIKNWFANELENPSQDLVKLILKTGIYDGIKNQNTLDKFTPIVKKAINQYVNDLMNSKIKTALAKETIENEVPSNDSLEEESSSKIVTTIEELEAFAIIKSILRKTINIDRLTYKDTESYFGILLDNNSWKWICRVALKENSKSITLPGPEKAKIKYEITSLDDLFNFTSEIISVCDKLK